MVEEKARNRKVLEELSKYTEPVGSVEIGKAIGETAFNVGHDLYQWSMQGYAQKPDEKLSLWLITNSGLKYLGLPQSIPPPPPPTIPPPPPPTIPPPPATETPSETLGGTVPSQADIFRSVGQKLGVGARKGDVALDPLIYYVERTANLEDLNSVWNALGEMAVANDVRKRWIKLYAQTIPGKEISEELKQKLETAPEGEKVTEPGKPPPLPNRFNVVDGKIFADPEGEYNWSRAIQLAAQQKGASPDEASSLALALSKAGPEMVVSIMGVLTPLISKETPKPDTQLGTIQVLKDAGIIGGKEGGTLETIQTLKELGLIGGDPELKAMLAKMSETLESGGKKGESDEMKLMRTEIAELKNTIQKKAMDDLQSELGGIRLSIKNLSDRLEHADREGRGKSEYDIMAKTLDLIDRRMGSMEGTIAGFVKRPPKPLTATEQAEITQAIDEAVTIQTEAGQLAKDLWGKPSPSEGT